MDFLLKEETTLRTTNRSVTSKVGKGRFDTRAQRYSFSCPHTVLGHVPVLTGRVDMQIYGTRIPPLCVDPSLRRQTVQTA
jgi:hypothetical protein